MKHLVENFFSNPLRHVFPFDVDRRAGLSPLAKIDIGLTARKFPPSRARKSRMQGPHALTLSWNNPAIASAFPSFRPFRMRPFSGSWCGETCLFPSSQFFRDTIASFETSYA